MGQLLVVVHHTDNSPSLCYEPELIPEPWYVPDNLTSGARVLGSERIMSRQLESYGINILQLHVEWLVANGYKLQASSCKKQIRMIFRIILNWQLLAGHSIKL